MNDGNYITSMGWCKIIFCTLNDRCTMMGVPHQIFNKIVSVFNIFRSEKCEVLTITCQEIIEY